MTKVQQATRSEGSLPPKMLCMLRSPGKARGAWLTNGAGQIPADGRTGPTSRLRGSRQRRPALFSRILCAHGNTGRHGAIDMGRISFVPALLRLQCSCTLQTWYPELQGAYHGHCLKPRFNHMRWIETNLGSPVLFANRHTGGHARGTDLQVRTSAAAFGICGSISQ